MYPYDENNNLNSENENTETGSGSGSSSDDGSYRMVRPDAGKSFDERQTGESAEEKASSSYTEPKRDPCYRDANYTSEGSASNYYSPTPSSQHKASKPKKERRGMPAAAIVALCLVCALVGGGFGGVIANSLADDSAPAQTTTPLVQTNAPTTSGSGVVTDGSALTAGEIYYDLALKQVVGISSEITTTNIWGMQVQGSVSGTGFVISEDGYILTNYHVIEDAYTTGADINVMFSADSGYDTTQYTAQVVGFERNNDVAVIKIDATGLTAATLGSSDDLHVGDTVYAVGNPLGELTYSMTPGIVSATDRVITTEEGRMNMFQISAAVNEGNSGGPVYNAYGQVVGIVTAKPNSTSSGNSTEGIGFAIPINDAVRIADSVINGDNQVNPDADPAYMGVTVEDPQPIAQQYYGWPDGAYVRAVEAGGPADKAGVREGDIITEVDGYSVTGFQDLSQELTFHTAGETCDIVVYRSGEYVTLSITFGTNPNRDAASATESLTPAA